MNKIKKPERWYEYLLLVVLVPYYVGLKIGEFIDRHLAFFVVLILVFGFAFIGLLTGLSNFLKVIIFVICVIFFISFVSGLTGKDLIE